MPLHPQLRHLRRASLLAPIVSALPPMEATLLITPDLSTAEWFRLLLDSTTPSLRATSLLTATLGLFTMAMALLPSSTTTLKATRLFTTTLDLCLPAMAPRACLLRPTINSVPTAARCLLKKATLAARTMPTPLIAVIRLVRTTTWRTSTTATWDLPEATITLPRTTARVCLATAMLLPQLHPMPAQHFRPISILSQARQ